MREEIWLTLKKKNPPSHVSVSILAKVHSDHFLSIKT